MSSLWEVLKNTEKVKTENGTFFIRRHDRVKQLEAENAKLRELVQDFERYRFGNCQHCGYEEQCMARQTNCYKVHLDLIIRARELGLVAE